MYKQKGFTLLEVLIVVVIAVSVAAFGVPAYKKTQDRNRFLAAQGVLMDIGNGVKMLQADVSFDFPTSGQIFQSSWQNSYLNPDVAIGSWNATTALFARKYMSAIPFDSGNSYKGYYFSLCPENKASNSNCCANNEEVVACMFDPNYSTRASKGQYYGALYLKDGTIQRVTK